MEIEKSNFEKLCPLVKFYGYKINGMNKNGIMLLNELRNEKGANLDVNKICSNCGCHTMGNCNPEPEVANQAEIYAKIS